MEQYRTEEEQVEALKKWWDENGRSTIVAVIVALGIGFGWQGWKGYQQDEAEAASNSYQEMLQQLALIQSGGDVQKAINLGGEIKQEYSRSTYAQFAALHLGRLAVQRGDLATAEAELRWVLGRADKGSDTAQLAQLRLARVLASSGESEQALTLLAQADAGAYAASYAIARGDALLALGRSDEAREAYTEALALSAQAAGQVNLVMLQQKIQSLSSIPASATAPVEGEVAEVQAVATPAITTETENDTLEQAEPAAAEE